MKNRTGENIQIEEKEPNEKHKRHIYIEQHRFAHTKIPGRYKTSLLRCYIKVGLGKYNLAEAQDKFFKILKKVSGQGTISHAQGLVC